jgi:ribonuclease BN (tRNA processing enzyme)
MNQLSPPTYTLDVLTDGSEYTGDGTLFLSVWKSSIAFTASPPDDATNTNSTSSWHERVATNKLIARYAVTGLGDLLARLVADQRYKLNTVQAVFCSTNNKALWGLPALNMALYGAGAAEVSIISTQSQRVESVLALLESHRKNPTVHLCQVPNIESDSTTWWKVFQDYHLLVHAQRCTCDGEEGSVVFLYTLLQVNNGQPNSFLILPPRFQAQQFTGLVQALPMLADDTPVSLFLGVVLKSQYSLEELKGWNKELPAAIGDGDMLWYVTRPTDTVRDPGILVRAQHQSRLWNATAATNFPLNSTSDNGLVADDSGSRLRSGTSLIMTPTGRENVVVDRRWTPSDSLHDSTTTPFWLKDLQTFARLALVEGEVVVDENEIDLDEDVESDPDGLDLLPAAATRDDTNGSRAELLVLGTGCASPSPYRGASGFALALPHNLTVVFEVGEGFVAQWYRHGGKRDLSTIRVIWISHAHWDHYGGLVPLLNAMRQERRNRASSIRKEESSKRARGEPELPPWVIASNKIFAYLNLMLKDDAQYYFRRVSHDDRPMVSRVFEGLQSPEESFRPIVFWESVRVDHSCASAYGFVMGLHQSAHRQGQPGSPFVFCFSGDTRPCWRLVQACRQIAARCGASQVDFLLHEATFDENEKEMSLAKKHSTVQEALQVAKDVNAKRILLTHFSQRYKGSLKLDEELQGNVGLAVDGLLVPLFQYN